MSVNRRTYQARKERIRKRDAAESRAGRDIGPIPRVRNWRRKRAGSESFRFFCEAYFKKRFPLAWSSDHLKVIAKIEAAVLHGGLFAVAMPRGSGKTSLAEVAVLWAVLNAHHAYVMLIGAAEDAAAALLANLKAELSGNDLLLEDYPEVVFPIRALENEARRCVGQLCRVTAKGQPKPTRITWAADEIVLPTIAKARTSGAVIRVAGITGHIRGPVRVRADGKSVRPSLVILDDPQTDQSARSPSQCQERERVIAGAVLGLAGPGRKISAVMPCTVIVPDDMADRLLNRELHPDWQGERTKMVYSFPSNEKLWKQYAQVRQRSLREDGTGAEATEFYRVHRAEMDAGAVVAWPERHNPDELSAIQNAMNLRLRDEQAFWAEYQNEPKRLDDDPDFRMVSPVVIAQRCTGLPRGAVPSGTQWLTAFVDVHGQGSLLYWMVTAWRQGFSGSVVDYGAFPDQRRAYFVARDARPTLAEVTGASSTPGAVLAGLEQLVPQLLAREWQREDGAALRIERALIDSGYESKLIYSFCRRSVHAASLMPSKGIGIAARHRPMDEYSQKRGERLGEHWKIEISPQRERFVLIDANWWKTFAHERLRCAPGDPGAVTFFGRAGYEDHRLLADHLTAETCVRTEGRGRVLLEWTHKPGRPDNHWLDCLVGCAVGASMLGAKLALPLASKPAKPRPSVERQRVSYL